MPSAADTSDLQQQGQRQPRRRRLPRTPLLLAAIAAAVYANTLTAQFTFDDSFAIVSCVGQGRGVVQGVLLLQCWRDAKAHQSACAAACSLPVLRCPSVRQQTDLQWRRHRRPQTAAGTADQ